jgi:LacI family transcriptional regulator, repressor for deo operon, udp, cdd, tsx, nupC, and nupG
VGATVRDVASLAGVSAATVSRALHGHRSISEATRLKVVQAAQELGYTLPTAVSDRARVAVVMPYLDRWYFAQVLDGVERALADRNILMVVQRLVDLDDRRRALLGDIPRREADGVLLVNVPPAPDEVTLLAERRIPLVLLGASSPGVPSVEIDDVAAARSATAHLAGLGHRRMGLLSGRPFERIPFTAPPQRRRGFLLAHKDAGLPWDPDLEATGDFTVRGAHRAALALLDRPDPPTAVFAESDEMAVAVLAVARQVGLRVPEDLSVVGFDDHDLAEPLGLTTVAQPVRTLGELAALQLAGLVTPHGHAHDDHAAPTAQRVMVPTMLVVRSSTAPPRADTREPHR